MTLFANRVLVPFERDDMLTIDSPFFVTGSKKVQPRKPPSLGQHSKEVLEECGYDNAALEKLRETGAVKWG
jgi:formyl-CoA transferase